VHPNGQLAARLSAYRQPGAAVATVLGNQNPQHAAFAAAVAQTHVQEEEDAEGAFFSKQAASKGVTQVLQLKYKVRRVAVCSPSKGRGGQTAEGAFQALSRRPVSHVKGSSTRNAGCSLASPASSFAARLAACRAHLAQLPLTTAAPPAHSITRTNTAFTRACTWACACWAACWRCLTSSWRSACPTACARRCHQQKWVGVLQCAVKSTAAMLRFQLMCGHPFTPSHTIGGLSVCLPAPPPTTHQTSDLMHLMLDPDSKRGAKLRAKLPGETLFAYSCSSLQSSAVGLLHCLCMLWDGQFTRRENRADCAFHSLTCSLPQAACLLLLLLQVAPRRR
jgi:hypothetical protein